MTDSLGKVAQLSSSKNIIGYRLGLYDPDPEDGEIRFFGPIFRPEQKAEVQRIIERYTELTPTAICLGAFSVEA
jgi:hypothetical protein